MWPQRVVADGDRTLGDVRGNRPIANERLLGAVPCPQGAALRLNLSTDSIWICSTLGCTGVGCFPTFHTRVPFARGKMFAGLSRSCLFNQGILRHLHNDR